LKALVYHGPGEKSWTDAPDPQIENRRTSSSGSTRRRLTLVASGRLNVDAFATHHFKLHDTMDAYDTFGRAAETKALKVIIDR
jgi:threonine dehydrogenase-like Zn-dependent dehydrogenase